MNIAKFIVTSANWDAGRGGHPVTGIVLHTMVGTTAGAQSRFNNPTSQVSVHYGVSLDGSIHQWVEEANTAYQAGNYPVNQTTIGIEHEDSGNANDPVRTAAEYESSSDLVADICKRYNLPCDTSHILLHKNVIDKTRYPGGTACPDGLDTNKIITMAKAKIGEAPMFNEGDRQNINLYLFGKDEGLFKGVVGQDWKTAMYGLFKEGSDFDFQYKVNSGDIGNLNKVLGTSNASITQKQNWKDTFYDYIAKNLPTVIVTRSGALKYVEDNLK